MNKRQYLFALVVLAVSGMIGGGIMTWLGGTGLARAQAGSALTASEIRLVDETGRAKAVLSLLRGQPRLIMIDGNGEFRVELGLGKSGEPSIWLRDSNGKVRANLMVAAKGGPSLIMSDEEGLDRIALWQEKGEMGMALADKSGRPRAGLAIKNEDQPYLGMYTADGKTVWYAPRK